MSVELLMRLSVNKFCNDGSITRYDGRVKAEALADPYRLIFAIEKLAAKKFRTAAGAHGMTQSIAVRYIVSGLVGAAPTVG